MRIAFTHNLQLTSSEEEAEFDRPETVRAIAESLRRLGHDVEPVEVSGPASRVVARLEALNPDLVFNTAEGTRGRFREAFYPALLDRLAMPFTGSDAYVCALTLDKNLTKTVLRTHGIPSPRGVLIDDVARLDTLDLCFPLMTKPNYEGSSMGITSDSVVDDIGTLRARVVDLLARYPAGVLVEEFITGRDLVVPFLEKASPETRGVLEPASYEYDAEYTAHRKYQIYDFELKTTASDAVHVKVPAEITPEQRKRAMELSRTIFKALSVRDVGRIDFRITANGELYFLEINPLPSLEPGASIFSSAALVGLNSIDAVLDTIVRSAADRYGLSLRPARISRRRAKLRVGLTFNLRRLEANGQEDTEAEYDSPETIAALRQALESYDHEVVELEATPELPSILPAAGVDVVFNLAEGLEGRHRESQVPALLELLGIAYTGSDPTALSLSLDKSLAKRVVAQAGMHTPSFFTMTTGKEKIPKNTQFPVIVKPVAEGSSKGIIGSSVVENEAELRDLARELTVKYRQAVLVEGYLPGREFTLALLGEKRPRVLPPMEVIFTDPQEKFPTYSFASKFAGRGVRCEVPAKVSETLRRELDRVARGVFVALGCRDLARVDLRLDMQGRIHFIECNPLPGLAPGFSDLCIISAAAGHDYRTLVGEILAPAIRRMRERKKQRLLEARF